MRTSRSTSRKVPTLRQLEAQRDAWNARYPVATPVKLYRLIHPREELVGTFNTQTPAEILSGHTVVVWLMSHRGCVAIEACEPVEVKP